jgi:hypothetical protein
MQGSDSLNAGVAREKTKMQNKQCIDVYGLTTIFSRLQQLANACGKYNADPFSIILSTLVIPHTHVNDGNGCKGCPADDPITDLGFGSELLNEWCNRVDDGWERKHTVTPDEVVLSGQSKDVYVSELVNGLGESDNKKEFRAPLKDLHFSRLIVNDKPVNEPFATERRTKDLIAVIWDSKKTARPIKYVVNIFGSLKYVELLHKSHPNVVVYNLIDICLDVCTGEKLLADGEYIHNTLLKVVEPDNREDEFPALADVEKDTQEIIVDNMLIKGNVHVVSGPPEAFKTMGLIELSSAVLDERPVFDLLKVNHRYPILFLCADMSPVQLDEWAAPFNLRKHGNDFRVMKGNAGIPNITDPVLQKAVQGRILILDTMLDFAKIQKAFESGEWNMFMQQLRELTTVHGCIAVLMTAHATRAEVKSDSDNINAAQYFKDSVTFHGKVDIGFGCKVLKETAQVKWERIKSRGFKYNKFSFTVAVYDEAGNSNLDRGRFPVCTPPEGMKQLTEERKAQNGRKPNPEKQRQIDFAVSASGSLQDKADAVYEKFGGTKPDKSTILRWLKNAEPFDSTQGETA